MGKEFLALGTTLAVTALVAPATAVAASTADRLAGTDRYDTAIQIADEFKTSDVVYLACGDNQADAVAEDKLKNGPLLLVNEGSRTRGTVATEVRKLKAKHVVVLDDVDAVSDDTAKAAASNADILQISGANRFETVVEISKALTNNQTAAKVYLADGMTLMDALAGGTIPDNAPILLTNGSGGLPFSMVAEIKRLKPTEVVALGGVRAVKTDELNAASRVSGSGGGLSQNTAVKKVTAGLAKEFRGAKMQLKGWFAVAEDVNLNQFMDSGCVAAVEGKEDKEKAEKKAALKANVEMTLPRVLSSDVNNDCDKRIFQVDGATSDGNLTEAKAKTQMLATVDDHGVATFMGLEKSVQMAEEDVKKTAEAAKTEAAKRTQLDTKKEKEAADSAILKAGIALSFEKVKNTYREVSDAFKDVQGAKNNDKVKQLIQAVMGGDGVKTSRIAGNDRYQTALEIAKMALPSGGNAEVVYVANGTISADATMAGFIDNKAELTGPVLPMKADTVLVEAEAYLKVARQANSALEDKLKTPGGAMVISDTMVDTVKGLLKQVLSHS